MTISGKEMIPLTGAWICLNDDVISGGQVCACCGGRNTMPLTKWFKAMQEIEYSLVGSKDTGAMLCVGDTGGRGKSPSEPKAGTRAATV